MHMGYNQRRNKCCKTLEKKVKQHVAEEGEI